MKATVAAEKVDIGLSDKQRDGVVEILNNTLADLHVLYVKTRNYHWNVTGIQFRDFHKLLEDQYDQLSEAIDEVAERVRQLGAPAPGSMQEYLKRARLKEVTVGMTRVLVVQAWGSPQEMRPGRAGEEAGEVWVYRRADLDARVGFRDGTVAWLNLGPEDGGQAAGTPRQALAPGRSCATLEADLGPAEAVEEEFDAGVGRQVTRYRWGPTTADHERTFVVCDQGAIASVRRAAP